jgi:hypothetical protein
MNTLEKARRTTGAIMLIVSVCFLVFATPAFGLNVAIPNNFWYASYPDGPLTSPTYIVDNQNVDVTLTTLDKDSQGRFLPGNPVTWIVTAQVKDVNTGGLVETLILAKYDTNTLSGPVGKSEATADGLTSVFVFSTKWHVPAGSQKLYSITFNVVFRDSWWNIQGDPNGYEYTVYAKTASSNSPDGTFTINGQSTSAADTVILLTPTLNLQFQATRNPDQISKVYVDIMNGDTFVRQVTLTSLGSGTYTGTYTLTSSGSYTFNGYFVFNGQNVQKMSIPIGYTASTPTPINTQPTTSINPTQSSTSTYNGNGTTPQTNAFHISGIIATAISTIFAILGAFLLLAKSSWLGGK